MHKPQLLSPVGSWETLIAAVSNGADAVYMGTKLFNARRLANNFRQEDLVKAIQYAHMHNVKVYITLNTSIKNHEISPFLNQLSIIEQANADAVIIQDLSFAPLIKKYFPNLEVHASTQATLMNTKGVEYWKPFVDVFVLARELSKEQIKKIYDATKVRLEVFVHGHLCSSFSGQCLISSLIGKRSGNRGLCASACRKPYNADSYLISAKDLNLLKYINELLESGASTLKIEGRMKPAQYVGAVTRQYREKLDQALEGKQIQVSERDIQELKLAFNRNFTSGYFTNQKSIIDPLISSNRGILLGTVKAGKLKLEHDLQLYDGIGIVKSGKRVGEYVQEIFVKGENVQKASVGDVISLKIPAFENGAKVFLTSQHQGKDLRGEKKLIPLTIRVTVKEGMKPTIHINVKGSTIEYQIDEIAAKATKHPLTKELLETECTKFESDIFTINDLEIKTDNSFVPKSLLTKFRNELDTLILDHFYPNTKEKKTVQIPEYPCTSSNEKKLHVQVYTLSDIDEALKAGADVIYYDVFCKDLEKAKQRVGSNAQFFLFTPMVLYDEHMPVIEKIMEKIRPDGILINNWALLTLTTKCRKILGYQMNIFNDNQLALYQLPAIVSLELNAREISQFKNKKGLIYYAHGKPVVMTFNEEIKSSTLTDQKEYSFDLRKTKTATEMLYSKKIGLLQHTQTILDAGVSELFLDLQEDVFETVTFYKKALNGQNVSSKHLRKGVTVGNLEKGVM